MTTSQICGARSLAPNTFALLLAVPLTLAVALAASADTVTFVSTNEIDDGHFGGSVCGIPDIDGDGLDDFIVGAPGEDPAGFDNAGRVYVYSGASGDIIRVNSSPSDQLNGRFGTSVAGVADLNNDGLGDYVVGAPGEFNSGRVYVFSGANGALIRTHISGNPVIGGEFGCAVGGVDDLNLDGRGDYVIGARYESAGVFSDAGRIYVASGGTGSIIFARTSPSAESNGAFGTSVAGVPDTNGDGRGDIVVGAPFEDPGAAPIDSGRAYLFSGVGGGELFTFASGDPEVSGRFGTSVGGIPDVGGNGLGDVIVGAPYETVNVDGVDLANAGRAYVYSGTGGFLAHTFVEKDANVGANSRFGMAVSGVPDMNDDALGDVIIGAPGWPGYYAYVIAVDSETVLRTLNTTDDFGTSQEWGGAVTGIGDVNGDGLGDYAVGGRGADDFPGGPSAGGRASLYRHLENDDCGPTSTSKILVNGPNDFTTIGATIGGPIGGCVAFAAASVDAWFSYEATATGILTVSTCNSANFNTELAIYDGCGIFCPGSDPLACNDNALVCCGCGGGTSLLTVSVQAGECYTIRIGGGADQMGTGVVTLTIDPCNPADLNADGAVNATDLAVLLGAWGNSSAGDVDGNGVTDAADIALLLGAWGGGC